MHTTLALAGRGGSDATFPDGRCLRLRTQPRRNAPHRAGRRTSTRRHTCVLRPYRQTPSLGYHHFAHSRLLSHWRAWWGKATGCHHPPLPHAPLPVPCLPLPLSRAWDAGREPLWARGTGRHLTPNERMPAYGALAQRLPAGRLAGRNRRQAAQTCAGVRCGGRRTGPSPCLPAPPWLERRKPTISMTSPAAPFPPIYLPAPTSTTPGCS